MLGNDIVAEFVAEHELLPVDLTDTADITTWATTLLSPGRPSWLTACRCR